MESPPGPEIIQDGTRYLYFGGTGYHCLQGHPELIDAAAAAMKKYGMGTATGGTRPVGMSPVQVELEREAARFFAAEDAVCIASGYMVDAVGLAVFAGSFDRLFVDETSHYSVQDAVRLTGKPASVFSHLDPRDLERRLGEDLEPGETPLLVSDGVFPTFGEIAPVDAYVDVLEPRGGGIWLDDAHAVGVIGPMGRGTLDHHGISGERFRFGGSLAKAVGGHGGVIPGSKAFCDRIRRSSPFLKGASSISVPAAAASKAGLEILVRRPEMRARLAENARRCKQGIRRLGFSLPDSPQPVAAFSLGSAERNQDVHRRLMERGILVPCSTYIGAGEEGVLRIVLFSAHTEEQIDRLLGALGELVA